ncbi:MAG: MFS transporter [Candidatus Latescibacteria bacterium]|nr:MFS transporter [Candidatus Latescibacterota bacterium]
MQISWKRNFYTLWVAELMAIIGFHAIQPFLPYYIQEFEVKDLGETLIWAGHMGTAAGLAMAISSPFWGALADRLGRKPMVVRSMIGGGLTVIAMAYVTSVEQLLVVRILQGTLAGTVTACMTLVSTTTPSPHLSFALGLMQGAFMLGASVGPLIGGPFIDRFGYHPCLIVAGLLVVLAGIAVQLWVKEDFQRQPKIGAPSSVWKDAWRLLEIQPFFIMLVSLTLIQFIFGFIMPVVPLFIQELAHTDDVLSLAGLIFSVGGLVGALSSVLSSRWCEHWGAKQTLVWGLLASAVFYLAQGLSTSVAMLAVLMVCSGLATGAIRPVANTLIARVVPESDRGKAYGVMSSASSLGWSLGPVMGGYVGAHWGFRTAFFVTTVLFVVVACWIWKAMQPSTGIGTGRVALDEEIER